MAYREVLNEDGSLQRVRANFGKNKEICLSFFNGTVYSHVSDKSKCFDGKGGFDFQKAKNVSLTFNEAQVYATLIGQAESYVERFLSEDRDRAQTPPPPSPSPPSSPGGPDSMNAPTGHAPTYGPPVQSNKQNGPYGYAAAPGPSTEQNGSPGPSNEPEYYAPPPSKKGRFIYN